MVRNLEPSQTSFRLMYCNMKVYMNAYVITKVTYVEFYVRAT